MSAAKPALTGQLPPGAGAIPIWPRTGDLPVSAGAGSVDHCDQCERSAPRRLLHWSGRQSPSDRRGLRVADRSVPAHRVGGARCGHRGPGWTGRCSSRRCTGTVPGSRPGTARGGAGSATATTPPRARSTARTCPTGRRAPSPAGPSPAPGGSARWRSRPAGPSAGAREPTRIIICRTSRVRTAAANTPTVDFTVTETMEPVPETGEQTTQKA